MDKYQRNRARLEEIRNRVAEPIDYSKPEETLVGVDQEEWVDDLDKLPEKQCVYATINGKRRFIGKIIKDVFVREFPFEKAVKWASKEVSMDKGVWEYVKDKVKCVMFTDTVKKRSYVIGVKKFGNHLREDEYGEGRQVYIQKDLLKEVYFRISPYVSDKDCVVVGKN
jgi:hypothetical protein